MLVSSVKGGWVGGGRTTYLFFSISRTGGIGGLSVGDSWTHSSPMNSAHQWIMAAEITRRSRQERLPSVTMLSRLSTVKPLLFGLPVAISNRTTPKL
ncbi:hypothetical protein AKJ16_DCAP03310 [Drosera capensis]